MEIESEQIELKKNELHPIVQDAIKILDEIKLEYKTYTKIIRILYPNENEIVCLNRFRTIRKGNINQAKNLIEDYRKYKENISDVEKETDKEIDKEIDFSDVYNFFISKKVCNRFKEEKYSKIEGLYLLLRKSNVAINKILVSYLDVRFEDGTLHFKSVRNNLHNHQDLPDRLHRFIETNGIITATTKCSYFGIGISKDLIDHSKKAFIETMVIRKNEDDSNHPISGYWSGSGVLNTSNPFISKMILIKIKNSHSEKEIREEIKNIHKVNSIIKLHKKEELSNSNGIFYKIISNEYAVKKENEIIITPDTIIKYILDSLDLKINEETGVFHLETFA